MSGVRSAGQPPAATRPSWWSQAIVVVGVWWAYDAVNNLNPLRAATALGHGSAIVRVETALRLDPERQLNRWLAAHLAFGRWIGGYYGIAHFAVTAAVLVYVWWRHPRCYRVCRNALLGINLIGFVVFWVYPVAPPRMLSGLGFVDVAAAAHSLGAGGPLASQANEYAAMPSLHVAWALWCTFAVWAVRKDRPTRMVAAGYAVLTVVLAMATANHYFFDVVAGAATAATAARVAIWHSRRGTPAVTATGLAPPNRLVTLAATALAAGAVAHRPGVALPMPPGSLDSSGTAPPGP
jgi:hypothetical protein